MGIHVFECTNFAGVFIFFLSSTKAS